MIEPLKFNWPIEHLKCHYHKDQIIQNFCICDVCLLPLCPKCIKTHTDEHCRQNTCSSIQTFQETVERAIDEITQSLKRLKGQFGTLKQYNSQKYVKTIKQEISIAKSQALEEIESYFEKLESALVLDTNKRIQQFHLSGSVTLNDSLDKQIKIMQHYLDKITKKYSLSDLIKYLSSEEYCNSLNISQTIKQKTESFNKNHLSLKVHRVSLYDCLRDNIEIIYPIPSVVDKFEASANFPLTVKTALNYNLNANYHSVEPLKKCCSKLLKPRNERCCNNQTQRQLKTLQYSRANRRQSAYRFA